MSYNTSYKLEWSAMTGYSEPSNCGHRKPPGAQFCPQCGVEVGTKGLNKVVADYIVASADLGFALEPDGKTNEATSWYGHEKDMREMSKVIPDVLFTLRGEGEESGDLWVAYFSNGRMQKCKAEIVYPPYDYRQLA